MRPNGDFSGVHVAMNACYDEKGDIHTPSLKRLTNFLVDKGVNGLYVGGGTGEGVLQSVEERKRVLETVIEENNGRVAVISHVGAATTSDSIQLAKHAEEAGAQAISSIPPFYYAYTDEAVKAHWLSMMDCADLPFIIYNIPASTGFTLSLSLFEELLKHEKMMGMKMTDFNTYALQQFKAAGGANFKLFNGPDQQYLAGRVMGADGGIGGTYGVMPELFVHMEKCIRENRLEDAQRWQFAVNEIITEMRALGLFGAIKALIKLRGIDCGAPRLPLPALKKEAMPRVERLFQKMMQYIRACEQEQIESV